MSPTFYSILVSKADKCRRGEASQWTHTYISNILRAQHRETHIFCCDGPHNAAIVCLCPALYLCCAVPGTIPIVCVCVWTLLVAFLNNTTDTMKCRSEYFGIFSSSKENLTFFVVDVGKSRPSGINFFTEYA